MRRSRDTLKKVLIIYLVAGVLVALVYIQLNRYKTQNREVQYSFSKEVGNDGIKMYIDEAQEIGEPSDNSNLEGASDGTSSVADSQDGQQENLVTTDETSSDKKFYKFRTTNRYNQLRVRTGPDIDEAIIDKLPPNAAGYVLEKGDQWSYIMVGNITGYSSNTYLSFEEININELPENFPEEYK